MRRNPRIIQRPIVKKWCYTPTTDDGDENGGGDDEAAANFEDLEPFASEDGAIETQLPEEEGDMVGQDN